MNPPKYALSLLLIAWAPMILLTACGDSNGDPAQVPTIVTAPPPSPDVTKPSLGITGQSTNADKLTLTGTGQDNIAVTGITWTNNRGGSGSATSTNQWQNWTASGIPLQSGSNTITMTARDAAGNVSNTSVTIDYAGSPPPPSPDATAPSLGINGQSTNADKLTVTGTAQDNIAVTGITWTNNRGGSGSATSTNQWQNWTASGIPLQSGSNTVTMTAKDAAGNVRNHSLTVDYAPLATNRTLRLSWDPNPTADAVLGYIVYYGPSANTATRQISDLSLGSGAIDPNAPAVTYNAGNDLGLKTGDPICLRLTAYNSAGPSDFSAAACTNI